MAKDKAGMTPAPRKTTTKKPATTAKKVAGKAAPARRKVGAPSMYSEELAQEICRHIADCVSLRTIAAMEGMPDVATIMRWLADETKPEFREQYARAREAQADKMAEDILAIADEECTMVRADKHGTKDDDGEGGTQVVFDATAVARNKLRVDARRWLASKMAPKKYGDKVQAELTGAGGGAIQVASTVTFVLPPQRDEDD